MSNSIEAQADILSEIVGYLYDSAPSNFEEVTCTFDYFCEDDGSWSVGSQFSYRSNGKNVGGYLNDQHDKVASLVSELHSVMHSHTGGKWNAFTLSVKNGSQANVTFRYD